MLTFVDEPLSTRSNQLSLPVSTNTLIIEILLYPRDVGNKMIRAEDRFLTYRASLFESIESPKMFMLLMFRVVLFKNDIFTSFTVLLSQ